MRKETKIGILLVLCIIILIWGLKFLKGVNLLSTSQTFYIEYPYATLNPSTAVTVSGQQVGVVTDVFLKPEDLKTVVVEINVEGRIQIPKSTEVQIIASSFLGDKLVQLKYDGPCSGADCAKSGDYLKGRNVGLVESMVDAESIDDIMGRMKDGAAGVFDTLSYKLSNGAGESETMAQISKIINNLDGMTRQINDLLYKSSGAMVGMMDNINSITANLAQSNERITGILANTEKLTGDLSKADISGTMESTKTLMSNANKTMSTFESTLTSTKQSMDELTELFGDMNDSEGSLGMLMKDKEFYTNMTAATRNLDLLLQDFRLNPKRYTTVLRRKSPDYVLPSEDPAQKEE